MHGTSVRVGICLALCVAAAACGDSAGGSGGFLPGRGNDDGGMDDDGGMGGDGDAPITKLWDLVDEHPVLMWRRAEEFENNETLGYIVDPATGLANLVGFVPMSDMILDRAQKRILYAKTGVVAEAIVDLKTTGGDEKKKGSVTEFVPEVDQLLHYYDDNDLLVEGGCDAIIPPGIGRHDEWFQVEPETGEVVSLSPDRDELCVGEQRYRFQGTFNMIGKFGYYLTGSYDPLLSTGGGLLTHTIYNYNGGDATPVVGLDGEPAELLGAVDMRPLDEGWAVLRASNSTGTGVKSLWMLRYEDGLFWKVGDYVAADESASACRLAADSSLWCTKGGVWRSWIAADGLPAGTEMVLEHSAVVKTTVMHPRGLGDD